AQPTPSRSRFTPTTSLTTSTPPGSRRSAPRPWAHPLPTSRPRVSGVPSWGYTSRRHRRAGMSAQPQEVDAGTQGVPAALQAAYEAQRRAYAADPVPTYAQRVADLRTLRRFIVENREALLEAVNRDYGNRSRHETLFGELVPVLDGIKHALRHLRAWMRPQRRGVDLLLFPG